MKVNEWVEIRKSKVHGKGGFALKDITKDTRVIEYVGKRMTKVDSDKKQDNEQHKGWVGVFELNKKTDIDGSVSWNYAKYLNHSCDPNCETDIIRGKIWIIAIKDIKKGEELTYDYNFDFEDDEDEEYTCKCRAKNCRGIIIGEDEYKKFLKKKKAKKKR